MLAAMGPRMLALAGARTDGTILWLSGPRTVETQIRPALDAAAAAAGRPAPRIVASVPVCVTDDPDAVKGLIAAVLDGYNDLPSYRDVMDREGAAGPADVSLVGRRSHRACRARAVRIGRHHRLLGTGDPDQPRRGSAHPRAPQGHGRLSRAGRRLSGRSAAPGGPRRRDRPDRPGPGDGEHGRAVRRVDVAAVLELGPHVLDPEPQPADRPQPGVVLRRIDHVLVRLECAELGAQQRGDARRVLHGRHRPGELDRRVIGGGDPEPRVLAGECLPARRHERPIARHRQHGHRVLGDRVPHRIAREEVDEHVVAVDHVLRGDDDGDPPLRPPAGDQLAEGVRGEERPPLGFFAAVDIVDEHGAIMPRAYRCARWDS